MGKKKYRRYRNTWKHTETHSTQKQKQQKQTETETNRKTGNKQNKDDHRP